MSNVPLTGQDAANATESQSGPPSSHDLVRSSEAVTAARSVRASCAAADDPPVTRGAPVLRDLPQSYGRDALRVFQRGPKQVAVFWDVHPETAQRLANSRWGIVVHTEDGIRRVEIRYGARCWYVDVTSAARGCQVEFGPLDDAGNLTPVATASLAQALGEGALGGPGARTLWGNGVVDESGTRLEVVGSIAVTADTEALLEKTRVAPGASSPLFSWSR